MTQTAIKERGIIFPDWSIPKILDGTMTMTRLVVTASNSTVLGWAVSKNSPLWRGLVWDDRVYKDKGPHILHPSASEYLHVPWVNPDDPDDERVFRVRSRYEVGDGLWVREAYSPAFRRTDTHNGCIYKADSRELLSPVYGGHNWSQYDKCWKAPRFMPRWASRIDLEITDLRAERLQDITEEDAIKEGVEQIFQEPDEHTNKALRRIGAKPVIEPYPIGYRNYLYKEDKRYRCCPPASMFPEYYDKSIDSFHSLWDSLNAKPKPVFIGGKIDHYVSYPWEDILSVELHRGKPWYVIGNPQVWPITFSRIE